MANNAIPLDTRDKLSDFLRWAEADCAALACDDELAEDHINLASSALDRIGEIRALLNGSTFTPELNFEPRIGGIVDKHIALAPHEREPLVKELVAEVQKHRGNGTNGDTLKDHASTLYTVETLLRDLNDVACNMALEISERERDSIQALTTAIQSLVGKIMERLDAE